jgi:hypothetical protein
VSKAQADTGDNHSISALKFGIIKKFLTVRRQPLVINLDAFITTATHAPLGRASRLVFAGSGWVCPSIVSVGLQGPPPHDSTP